MRKAIPYDIGFADGELLAYRMEAGQLVVTVQTWNLARLQITFLDTIGVVDLGLGDISGFVSDDSGSPFMDDALRRVYEQEPESHPYTLYHFLDQDARPSLTVVAADLRIADERAPKENLQ